MDLMAIYMVPLPLNSFKTVQYCTSIKGVCVFAHFKGIRTVPQLLNYITSPLCDMVMWFKRNTVNW